jgi:hypothetical protein
VRQDWRGLRLASEALRGDKEVVEAALRQDGFALGWASARLQADKATVLLACATNGAALAFASAALRDDLAVALAAVTTHGHALRHGGPLARADPGVVLAALGCCCGDELLHASPLKHAAASLQADRAVVLAAVARDGRALRFASPELQLDAALVAESRRVVAASEVAYVLPALDAARAAAAQAAQVAEAAQAARAAQVVAKVAAAARAKAVAAEAEAAVAEALAAILAGVESRLAAARTAPGPAAAPPLPLVAPGAGPLGCHACGEAGAFQGAAFFRFCPMCGAPRTSLTVSLPKQPGMPRAVAALLSIGPADKSSAAPEESSLPREGDRVSAIAVAPEYAEAGEVCSVSAKRVATKGPKAVPRRPK